MTPSLCFPDRKKSCFACCPPIRPAEYDHADHRNIIMRILRENSRSYSSSEIEIRSVTGFSCWALGYIDKDYRQVGCMLHPKLNNGKDLRYRIDYGSKCVRENCYEEGIFASLNNKQKYFWLSLTEGMDSFDYSSRKKNVLFRLLGWGNRLLTEVASNESGKYYSGNQFIKCYPFFNTELLPKGHSFLVNYIIEIKGVNLLKNVLFRTKYEDFSRGLVEQINRVFEPSNVDTFVHKLDIGREFSDFLRLVMSVKKATETEAGKLEDFVVEKLDIFCRNI